MEHAVMCPQCNAPLAPHRFARSIVCAYCGATIQLDEDSVSAEIFHQSFRDWNSPVSYQIPAWVSVGNSHWVIDQMIARGDIADVYTGWRARWPTELAVIKLLRDPQDLNLLDNEWNVLKTLQCSDAPGAYNFAALTPQPILHGTMTAGSQAGKGLSIFRWTSGFRHNFNEVIQAYPQGIPPRASIWVWRRILEVLSFIHASGWVHGAVLPQHCLVQENEHGVRLVGYGCAGRPGEKLQDIPLRDASFYPQPAQPGMPLAANLDLSMSARCISAFLGGNPATADLPTTVPARLAEMIRRIALSDPAGASGEDAWSIREELGEVAADVFGPSQFIPIVMPS
jgi:hypothetical protein